jgi:hypothetical protein
VRGVTSSSVAPHYQFLGSGLRSRTIRRPRSERIAQGTIATAPDVSAAIAPEDWFTTSLRGRVSREFYSHAARRTSAVGALIPILPRSTAYVSVSVAASEAFGLASRKKYVEKSTFPNIRGRRPQLARYPSIGSLAAWTSTWLLRGHEVREIPAASSSSAGVPEAGRSLTASGPPAKRARPRRRGLPTRRCRSRPRGSGLRP